MNDVPERKSYRLAYLTLAALAVILVVVAIGLAFSYSGNSASQDVRESTKRADCRSAYNADFTEVKNARDDLKLDLDTQYYTATYQSVITGQRATPEQVQHFGDTLAQLEDARAAVRALPRLDDAVDHGYTLHGIHHPPCPG
jgi:hypothetical protein